MGKAVAILGAVLTLLLIVIGVVSSFRPANAVVCVVNWQRDPITIAYQQGPLAVRKAVPPNERLEWDWEQTKSSVFRTRETKLSVAEHDVYLENLSDVWRVRIVPHKIANHIQFLDDSRLFQKDRILLKVMQDPVQEGDNAGSSAPGLRDTAHGVRNFVKGLTGFGRALP
jgi:hypothetical protein